MTSRLGVYWAPGHNRPSDLAYMRELQPAMIRILEPDVAQVSAAHVAAPGALIAPRFWSLDDDNFQQQERMQADPEGFAQSNATAQLAALAVMEQQARERGLPFPSRTQILLNALNEPTIWGAERAQRRATLDRYSVRFGKWIEEGGCGALLGCINGGQPDDWPVQWGWYGATLAWLEKSTRSMLELHEYWQPEGPDAVWTDETGKQRRDGGALAWRHKALPAAVHIVIGECGCDGVIYGRHAERNRGWRAFMSPAQYAEQLAQYMLGCDGRVVAALPFLTDYRENRNNAWDTFDTGPAHGEILLRRGAFEAAPVPVNPAPPIEIHLPIIETPGPVVPAPVDHFARVMKFISRWEGAFVNDPRDAGGATNMGITISTLTAWRREHGLPDATVEDVRNLSRAEADAIYRAWYWGPSGAAQAKDYATALLLMDSGVLHGVAAPRAWVKEYGYDPFAIAARRLRVYTGKDAVQWDAFGRGWTNRVADLLSEIGKAA